MEEPLDIKNFDYYEMKTKGTGGHDLLHEYKIITYAFDKYRIKVKLSPNNEFIGITEVMIDKDFRSLKQKIGTKGIHDIEEFYRE